MVLVSFSSQGRSSKSVSIIRSWNDFIHVVYNLTLFSPSKVCVCGLFAGYNHFVIVVYNANSKEVVV